jgi:hypothetical protein
MMSSAFSSNPFLTLLMLLLGLMFKHFLADFPLQSQYMLKKTAAEGWLLPLAAHCAIHGLLTFWVVVPFSGLRLALLVAVGDFLAHLLVDYWKAHLTHYTVADKGFWVTLGIDQMLHNFTYIAIAFICVHPSAV